MSEQARLISQQEFERGLEVRTTIGELLIGAVFAIRMEGPDGRCAEGPTLIKSIQEADSSSSPHYDVGFSFETDPQIESEVEHEIFNADSIAIATEGVSNQKLRCYFAGRPGEGWDGALNQIVELEALGSATR